MKMIKALLVLGLLVCLSPSSGQAGQKSKHTVTLKWDAALPKPGQRIVGYNICRCDKANGKCKSLAKKLNSLTYTDKKVKSGHSYSYQVTSVNDKERQSTPAIAEATVP
jgi:fibronectin type 3 domain-containing protein